MSAEHDMPAAALHAATSNSNPIPGALHVDARKPKVVPHPCGGWTLAYPDITGTHRIYRGTYSTRHAAELANFS